MALPFFDKDGRFPASYGYSVRRKQQFVEGQWDRPTHIMFLYIRQNTDGSLEIAHYFDELKERAVEQAEAELLANARPRTSTTPPRNPEPQGYNFEGMNFGSYVSYFTIVLDEKLMEFHPYKENDKVDPIIFLAQKAVFDAAGDLKTRYFDPNFSIMNMERVEVPTATAGDYRPALRCVNFMKSDEVGTYLKEGQEQKFGFDLYVDMPFNRKNDGADAGAKMLTVIFDPGGTSTGPKKP
jgi:hypothetical protein